MLAADHDGGVVGTVVAGWDGWRGHVYRLAVDPEYRRQGVARTLLIAAHDRFAALGAVLADAMVEDDNTDARATYEALGYQRQPDRGRWVRDFLEGQGRRRTRGGLRGHGRNADTAMTGRKATPALRGRTRRCVRLPGTPTIRRV
ncbi:GNAT family N-acetyltransferase [Frankia gtarii]|uniref:GNAT family N-acetyltransferase n=1 Tax=Frankia gtarii TaxID=2950102 RepID=UPI0021C00210|nr:GNAT family N-acetyltransferase [Frankia gtarii]